MDSGTIKKKLPFLLLSIVLISGVLLFHFGPLSISPGDSRLLAVTELPDKSKLFIVAFRTEHFIDAYEVTLYRIFPDKSVIVNWLGFEDGYWWDCSFVPDTHADSLGIKAFGFVMAKYDTRTQSVTWNDGRVTSGHQMDGNFIKYEIPNVIIAAAPE